MDASRALTILDKHAAEFNFPILDNAYVDFAAARLTAFRSRMDWLVIFEILGYSIKELAFVNDLYAYGSCPERAGYITEDAILTSTEGEPLFDPETNEFLADWSNWSVSVAGRTLRFAPTLAEYSAAGISIDAPPGRGSLSEAELLRFLVHELGAEALFRTDEQLLSHFVRCSALQKLIQTQTWQHPDVAGGEKPSENTSMQSLIRCLVESNPASFDVGKPNTHWQRWTRVRS